MDDKKRSKRSFPSRFNRGRGSAHPRRPVPKPGFRRLFTLKWFMLVALTSFLLAIGGCLAVMMSAEAMPLEKMNDFKFASTIYDKTGKPVAKLGPNREYVPMNEMKSKELIRRTFVAVEDKRFYEHSGVDWKGMARAVVANITKGGGSQGGGTITMQVARNIILEEREKTLSRKLREIGIAWGLEIDHSKDEILDAYLNYIDFGNQAMGIQMASKIYFDKDLTKDELEPQEVALLAGLPKATTTYNPYLNPDKAKQRRNVVLMLMAEQGIITEEEKKKYQKMDLGVNKKYLSKHMKFDEFQAYRQYVLSEAKERYGLSEEDLILGGYDIHTHLNPKAQKAMETALKDPAMYHNHQDLDGGATMIDAKTGGIAAIGGGRRYMGRGYPIRALEKMQPGSSLKPITIYAPVVEEKGYHSYTMVKDPPGFSVGNWKPQNYQRQYYNELPMQDAVAKSLNVAAGWLLYNEIGMEKAVEYAEKAGIRLSEQDKSSPAALALGGMTVGENTLHMAQGYMGFANNGKMTPAHAIKKITYKGELKEPLKELKKNQQLYSPKTAYYMTLMLKYNVHSGQGTGSNARLPDGRDVAGKTGTTQGSKQAWFVGYTNEYVMAAVVFNTKSSNTIPLSGGQYPARIFQRVMAETLSGTPVSKFERPKGVEDPFQLRAVNDLRGSYNASSNVVNLTWTNYHERVKYRVERSEDGSDWQALTETEQGSFTDSNIVAPGSGGLFETLFGGGGPQQYYYRVVAVDKRTGNEAGASNSVVITITKSEEQRDQDYDDDDDDDD